MSKEHPFANTIDELGIEGTDLKVFRLTDGTNVNDYFLLHVRAVADERFSQTTEKLRFQVVVDIDAVFQGDITTTWAVNSTFMGSLEFFLHNHDFSKNLLPKPFRDLLEKLIKNKEFIESDNNREEDVSLDTYSELKDVAIKVLEMYDSLVVEYKRIKQNCMQEGMVKEAEELRDFTDRINDFEELVEKLRDYFTEHKLYLPKGRFTAGWTLEQNAEATKAVVGLEHKLTFGSNDAVIPLELSERVTILLTTLRDKLGAELSFFTDGTGTHALHLAEYVPGLGELIAGSNLAHKPEEVSASMIAKRADDESGFLSKVHSVDLVSISGTTLPVANTATPPEVTRRTICDAIDSEFMPVSLLVFADPKELDLAISIISKGGYAIYVRDGIQDARDSIDLEKVRSSLTDLQIKRLLFSNSMD